MERLFVKIRHFYVIISRFFFLILLRYEQNKEIRTTKATTTIIVIINIEKKNEMIKKMLVEIKRFITEKMVNLNKNKKRQVQSCYKVQLK